MKKRIRIVLADDHTIMREGLAAMMENEGDLEVVGEAANGGVAVKQTLELNPDVVVMDADMPGMDGVAATANILKALPGVRVVAFSMHCDARWVVGMLDAGVSGYVLKECAFRDLAAAIRTAMSGATYLSDRVRQVAVRSAAGREKGVGLGLTERQSQIVALTKEGLRAKEIAARLNIEASTVRTERSRIAKKLGLSGLADLIRYAMEAERTPPPR